jgi:hypothetical protein
MRKLQIEATANSPKINFDPDKNIFEIKGESWPHDAEAFYSQIIAWFTDYSAILGKSRGTLDPGLFIFDLDYFNSSSAIYILDICRNIARVRSKGKNISIRWHYEKDDSDMLSMGREMSRSSNVPFEYILKAAD